ncbi:MAG: hypothetical protein ACP5D7_11825 [Limnospira sp.]
MANTEKTPENPNEKNQSLDEVSVGLDAGNLPPKQAGLSQDKLDQVAAEINANLDRTQETWEQEQNWTDNKSTGRLT